MSYSNEADNNLAYIIKPAPDWGRINGLIEIPYMLEGLDDKRVLIILPLKMMQMRGDDWYPDGAFSTEGKAEASGCLRMLQGGPGRLYLNPEKLAAWDAVIEDTKWDAVLIPYPQTIGLTEAKKLQTLRRIKQHGTTFRISLRYWQTTSAKHSFGVVHLLTGIPVKKLVHELTDSSAQKVGRYQVVRDRIDRPGRKQKVQELVEPYIVRIEHEFDELGGD